MATVYEYSSGIFKSGLISTFTDEANFSYAYGTLFKLTAGLKVSYSYNPSVQEIFYHLDFGSILDNPINSWVIQNHANVVIQDYANISIIDLVYPGSISGNYLDHGFIGDTEGVGHENWGRIRYEQTIFSFGNVRLASSTSFRVKKHYVGTGQVFEFGKAYTRLVAPWIVSGKVRLFGDANTRRVPEYSSNGILQFRSATGVARIRQHIGSGTIFTQSFVSNTQTKVYNTGGLFKIDNAAQLVISRSYLGEGTLPTISSTQTNKVYSYVGSGSLLSFSKKDERVVYSYSILSIDEFQRKDFGYVLYTTDSWIIAEHADVVIQDYATTRIVDLTNTSIAIDYIDYGLVSENSISSIDWRYITETSSRYPFGIGKITGSAGSVFTPSWVGSGTIKVRGDVRVKQKPLWISSGTIIVGGKAKPNFSLLHIGSGSLFGIGGGSSIRSYGYQSSGSLFGFNGAVESVGFNPPDITIDIKLHGEAKCSFAPNWNGSGEINVDGLISLRTTDSYRGEGSLSKLGNKIETRTYSHNGSSVVVYDHIDYGNVQDAIINSWVIQDHANVVIEDYANTLLLNLVTGAVGSQSNYTDYGYINDIYPTFTDDYEYIIPNITRYPFGDLNIGGNAKPNFSLRHIGSGTIKVIDKGIEKYRRLWISSGTVVISGNVISNVSLTHIGSGSLFGIGGGSSIRSYGYQSSGSLYGFNGAAEAVGFNPPDITTDIKFVGSATSSFTPNWNAYAEINVGGFISLRATNSYRGEGSLFELSNNIETRTYSYNGSSVVVYDHIDYGNVQDAIINSWIIADHANVVIQDYANTLLLNLVTGVVGTQGNYTDYGYINDIYPTVTDDYEYIIPNITRYPFGIGKITGSAGSVFTPSWVGSGTIKVSGEVRVKQKPIWISSGTVVISGKAKPNFSLLHIGSGSLFGIGGGSSIRSYAYQSFGSLYAIAGAAEAVGFNPPDITTDIKFVGSATSSFTSNWNGSCEINVDGLISLRATNSYRGEGSLFVIGNRERERATYSYNVSSIVDYNHYDYGNVQDAIINSWIIADHANVVIEDYANTLLLNLVTGLVGSQANYTDYGYINHIYPTVTDDYEYIIPNITRYPFGVGRLISNTTTAFSPSYSGSGVIQLIDKGIEKYRRLWISSGTVVISGNAISNVSLIHIGSGSLFGIGGGSSIRSYGYQSSGSLFGLNGVAEAVGFNPPDITTDIKFVGSATCSFAPNWNGSCEINVDGLISLRATNSYRGEGSLFELGNKIETRTYSYNGSSIVDYNHYDYGNVQDAIINSWVIQDHANVVIEDYANTLLLNLVTGLVQSQSNYTDYGYITDIHPSINDDYEYIIPNITRYPFGVGRLISNTTTAFSPSYSGSGTFKVIDKGTEKYRRLWISSGTIIVGGKAKPNFSLLHIGSGSLFGISGGSSIRSYGYQSSGSLYAIAGAAEAVGFNPPDITTDIKFVGSATSSFTPNWNAYVEIKAEGVAVLRATNSYRGEGSLFELGNKIETRTYSYNGSSVVVYDHIDYGNVQDAIINSWIIADYANVVIEDYANTLLLNLVTGLVGSQANYIDYGYITDIHPSINDDYEYIIPNITRYPFGDLNIGGNAKQNFSLRHIGSGIIHNIVGEVSIRFPPFHDGGGTVVISGKAKPNFSLLHIGSGSLFGIGGAESKFVPNWNGSGSLFGLNGAAESKTIDLPEFTGLFHINGTASEKATDSYRGSGSLFGLNGAAEAVGFNPPDITTDIKLVGTANESKISSEFGSGSLFGFNGAAEAVGFNPPDITTDIKFAGTANESKISSEFGSGSLFGFGGLVESYTISEVTQSDLKIYGSVEERFILNFSGFGSMFAFAGASESITVVAKEEQVLFYYSGSSKEQTSSSEVGSGEIFIRGEVNLTITTAVIKEIHLLISGSTESKFVPNWNGSGSLYAIAGAAEAVGFNPPDITTDIKFVGSAIEKNTESYNGESSLRIFGEITTILTSAEQPSGEIILTGESESRFAPNWNGSGSLYGFNGAAEAVGFNPPDITTDIKFSGAARENIASSEIVSGNLFGFGGSSEIRTFAEQPSPTIHISGSASVRFFVNYRGFGFISTLSGAAESFTKNPDESTALFNFYGVGRQSFSFGNYAGRASVSIKGLADTIGIITFAEQPEIQIDITGDSSSKYVANYQGSGFISTLSGAAESFTKNPDESTALFSFVGSRANESTTSREIGSGIIHNISGSTSPEILTFAEQPAVNVTVFGNAVERNTENYKGSGNIFAIGGAAESFTKNPDESTALFDIGGFASYRTSFVEVKIVDAKLSGESTNKTTKSENGTGVVYVFGNIEQEKASKSFVGSGFISTLSGAAESFTANPEEQTALFSFIGKATEKNTESYVGYGNIFSFIGAAEAVGFNPSDITTDIKFVGAASFATTAKEIGSGNLFTLSNASFSKTNVHVGSGVITASGNAIERNTESYFGSGNIFSFIGAAEAVGFNPPDITTDIKFVGAASFATTAKEIGSGNLFGFGGATESRTISYQNVAAFNFIGSAAKRTTKTKIGSGSITISGNVSDSFTRAAFQGSGILLTNNAASYSDTKVFIGSGSLFGFNGAAEAVGFNPPDITTDIKLVGAASFATTAKEIGFGEIKVGLFAQTFFIPKYPGSGSINIESNGTYRSTAVFTGSGSIRNINRQATISFTQKYVGSGKIEIYGFVTERITDSHTGSGRLFSFGTGKEIGPSRRFRGSGYVIITGKSVDKRIKVSPPRTYGWII